MVGFCHAQVLVQSEAPPGLVLKGDHMLACSWETSCRCSQEVSAPRPHLVDHPSLPCSICHPYQPVSLPDVVLDPEGCSFQTGNVCLHTISHSLLPLVQ